MTNYVLTFRAQPHRTLTAEQEASWPAWFSQIGASITDMGNRVGQALSLFPAIAGRVNGGSDARRQLRRQAAHAQG